MIATQAVTEPFPGLRPFTAQESALFFGRDEQVEELLVRLATRRFLAVVGTSGSGKSSLVRAGLIPTVERGHLGTPGSRWVIATLSRPGLDPLHGLACALMEAFELEELELNKIEAELNRSSVGLSGFAGRHLRANERLLVFVDQFEELFRYRKQAGEEGRVKSTAFVKLLLAATGHSDAIPLAPGEPIYVVLTMRSDYLGKCAQFRGLPEALNDSQYLVPQMSRDQLREAIEGPVALAGAEISDTLVDRLLNDARNDADLLPILQHALFRVWEESSESRAAGLPLDIRHYDDEHIRGFNQALNLDAEAAFDKVRGDPGKREIARRMFQRIVEPGAEDEESRRPTRLSEIAAVCHTSGAEVRDVIEVFQSRRFVTLSDDDDPLVDISHESLIRQWRQLKAWANEEAQSASVYRRLAYEAVHGGASYRGRNLAEALLWEKTEAPNSAWAARYTGESGTFQKAIEFLRTSQRRERWQSAMFVFLFLTLAVAVFSLYLLLRSEQQKRVFKSLQLAAIAQLNRNIVSDRALLLGIQAYKTDRTVGARSALLTDLESNPGLLIYLHQSAPLHGVAFSRDGVTLASASEDNTVQLWNLVTGRPLGGPLRGHTGPVLSVAFSPDGKILASASGDQTVRLWDVAKRQVLGNPLQGGKDPVWSVAFSPDGKTLASASGEIHSSDGKTPARASGAVQLWNVETHEPVGGPLEGHRGPEWSVAFSPDGKTLASGSGWMQPEEGRRAGRAIGAVQLWDVSKGQFLGELLKAHSGPVRSVAFSPDGKTLAAASEDNTVQLWDVSKRQPVGEPLEGHENYVSSVAFSPDGKWLASASQDNTVQLWDLTKRQPQPLAEPLHHDSYVSSVAFSPDSKTLASASDDKTVRLWDVTLRQHLGKQLEGHQSYVSSVAFSPDGKTLASGSDDKTVQLWDVPHPEALGEPLRGHTDSVLNVAFSPDGKMLASAAGDQTIRLWDVARRQPLGVLRGHTDSVWSVAFSPDGKTLASASWDKTVRLWDVASRRPLGEPLRGHTDSVLSVAFSPDGKMLASASVDKTVRLWDVASRKPVGAPLQRHRGAVRSVAFSPDGKILASTGDDKAVQMWDVATQRQLGEPLQGHTLPVYNAVFSPDGNTLASASLDKTVRLWDVASREPVGAPLQGHTNWVLSVAFSPDGKTLASASVDETVRLWDIDPDYWVSRTCAMVDRNLSAAEWKQYVGTDTPYQKTCPQLPPGEGAPAK